MATDPDSRDEALDALIAEVERDLRRQGLASLARTPWVPRWVVATSIPAIAIGVVLVLLAAVLNHTWLVYAGWGLGSYGILAVYAEEQAEGSFRLRDYVLLLSAVSVVLFLMAHFVLRFDWLEAAITAAAGLLLPLFWALAAASVLRLTVMTLVSSLFLSLIRALPATVSAAGRVTPVALAVLVVGFFTNDAWSVVAAIDWRHYAGLQLVLLAVAAATAAGAAWIEREQLKDTTKPPPYAGALEEACRTRSAAPAPVKLTRLQRFNVATAFATTILARLVVVWALVTLMFSLIGVVAVDDGVARALTGDQHAAGGMSWTLIGLASLLGAVASLTFAAGALTDPGQRAELVADQARRLGGRLDAWARYDALASSRASTPRD